MKLVRLILDKLYEIPVVNKAEPLIAAVDAALFGPAETTKGGHTLLTASTPKDTCPVP